MVLAVRSDAGNEKATYSRRVSCTIVLSVLRTVGGGKIQ